MVGAEGRQLLLICDTGGENRDGWFGNARDRDVERGEIPPARSGMIAPAGSQVDQLV